MAARLRLWPVLCLIVLAGALLWLGSSAPTARAQAGCVQLLTNGGFETEEAWVLGANPVPPRYVTANRHGGSRSLLLGITPGGPNVASYSSARQTVALPAGATRITLSFWFYAVATGAPLTDKFELAILDQDGVTILDSPWESFNDSRNWNQMAVDLTRWRGRTVQIYFNAFNDGEGGVAALYLDDVALDSCPGATVTATATATATRTGTLLPTGTATPTPTQTPWIIVASPTPTTTPVTPIVVTATYTPIVVTATHTPTGIPVPPSPTPWIIVVTATYTPVPIPGSPTPIYVTPVPGQCVDLLHNGGFEEGLDWWQPGKDPIPVRVVNNQVRSGARALFLGTDQTNIYTYSSIRQEAYLDPTYPQLTLEFWTNTGAEALTGTDHQEAVLLDPDPGVIAKVWRVLLNERTWVQRSISLDEYAGRVVEVYFNVVNDGAGGRTWMYLDDVHLWGCNGAANAAGVAVSAGAQPVAVVPVSPQAAVAVITVVVTATPQPTPVGAEAAPAAPARGAGPTPVMTTIVLPTRTIALPTAPPAPAIEVTVPATSFRSFLDRVLPFPPLVRVIVVTLVAIGILLLLLRLLTR